MYPAIKRSAGLRLRAKPAATTGWLAFRNTATLPRLAQASAVEAVAAEDEDVAPIRPFAAPRASPAARVDPFQALLDSREFWRGVPLWRDVSAESFLSYRWSVANTVQGGPKLHKFLSAVLADEVPFSREAGTTQSRDELIGDIFGAYSEPVGGGGGEGGTEGSDQQD